MLTAETKHIANEATMAGRAELHIHNIQRATLSKVELSAHASPEAICLLYFPCWANTISIFEITRHATSSCLISYPISSTLQPSECLPFFLRKCYSSTSSQSKTLRLLCVSYSRTLAYSKGPYFAATAFPGGSPCTARGRSGTGRT